MGLPRDLRDRAPRPHANEDFSDLIHREQADGERDGHCAHSQDVNHCARQRKEKWDAQSQCLMGTLAVPNRFWIPLTSVTKMAIASEMTGPQTSFQLCCGPFWKIDMRLLRTELRLANLWQAVLSLRGQTNRQRQKERTEGRRA